MTPAQAPLSTARPPVGPCERPWPEASALIAPRAVSSALPEGVEHEYRTVESELARGAITAGHMDSYSPVLCLTVLDGTGPTANVLVGIRDPRSNLTHPSVLSTPTMRAPWADLLAIAASATGRRSTEQGVLLSGPPIWSGTQRGSSRPDRLPRAMITLVTEVLESKLGQAEGLLDGSLLFSAEPALAMAGAAYYGNLSLIERIVMVNVLVVIEAGATLFPSRTSSYDPLLWTPVPKFIKAVESRDPFEILEEGDPFEICVHGLCVAATHRILASTRTRFGW